jgi:aromatic-L-amino-acid decarboxylase
MAMQQLYPLEPSESDMNAMGRLVLDHVVGLLGGVAERPVRNTPTEAELRRISEEFLAAPPQDAGELDDLLGRLNRATVAAGEKGSPRNFSYMPSGGLFSSALGEFYARSVNRYAGVAFTSPGLVALEESVVRWLAQSVSGLPAGSGGFLTTGGSMANFSALFTAREIHLGTDIGAGTLYVTHHTHHSVVKAARMAGIPRENVREVPCGDDLTMDADQARSMIKRDKEAGLRPFLIVGTAGTTNTGAIDPLTDIAAVAAEHGLWFHVDGAYGGLFRLTERGRSRLIGVDLADSVTLDPHKSLFLPYGTGALLVRDPGQLHAAHNERGSYQQDYLTSDGLPDYSSMSPELSREVRGLRVWLPLHLHGVNAFRAELDEKLDLAESVYGELSRFPLLELPWRPQLSTVAFRVSSDIGDADQATRQLLERIDADGRFWLSSTRINGRETIRICILAHRTHHDHVAELVASVKSCLDTL